MTAAQTTADAPRMRTWVLASIAGGFGLFYAYLVWNAVAFLVTQATGPLGLSGLGWAVLLLAVLFPVLAFAGAFALGQRRGAGPFALLMLAGLALACVLWLNVVAYSATSNSLVVI